MKKSDLINGEIRDKEEKLRKLRQELAILKSESGSSPNVDLSVFDQVRGKSPDLIKTIQPEEDQMSFLMLKKLGPSIRNSSFEA